MTSCLRRILVLPMRKITRLWHPRVHP